MYDNYVVAILFNLLNFNRGGKSMKRMCESVEKQMYVTKLLLSLGVPAHLKGYHYLRSAILRSEQDIEVVSSVTKLLYPDVAREYNTSVQKVERAIRNAIEISWMRGNIESMEEMFGFSAHSGKGRPTNSEYIARVADAVHLAFLDEYQLQAK